MRTRLQVNPPWFLLLLSVLLAPACESGKPDRAMVLVRDSVGIRVVENLQGPAQLPVFASIDPAPEVEIGVVSGNPDQEFGWIRGAAFLPPDLILVADGQAREISVFRTDGAFLRRLGGNGEGPGEFQSLNRFQAVGSDSVAVWDGRARRITVLPIDGSEPRVIPFEGEAAAGARSVEFLADGTLVSSRRPAAGEFRQYPEPTLVQDSMTLNRLALSGEVLSSIGTFFSTERILKLTVDGSIVRTSEATPAFPRFMEWVCAQDRVVLGDNGSFQLDWVDFEGNLIQRSVSPGLEVILDQGMVSKLMEQRIMEMGGAPEVRRQVEAIFEDFPIPERAPAFTDLLVDEAGFVWVREYQTDWKQQAVWHVFA